jgi:hypothetical protein
MSYAKTAEGNCPKHSRLVGGQFPAKTSCQISQIRGIFASIRPVRPICPFRTGSAQNQGDSSTCHSLDKTPKPIRQICQTQTRHRAQHESGPWTVDSGPRTFLTGPN